MAKLKCLQGPSTARTIYKEGYINVANNLVLDDVNFFKFLASDPNERPGILQTWAGLNPEGQKPIEHEKVGGDSIVIDNDNCKILTQKDRRAKGNRESIVTVPLPPERPIPPVGGTDPFDYLGDYAKIIHDFYTSGTPADKKKAHSFMFGLMLLTRCR